MKYWYQSPHDKLANYVRTVLILEGFTPAGDARLPLFTNGMPAMYCRIEKDAAGHEQMSALTLFGQSTTNDCWTIDTSTTVIAYFFKPFALAPMFAIPAAQLVQAPMDLYIWNAHTINALRTQLAYTSSTTQQVDVLDNLLIHQLQQNSEVCELIQYATDQIMANSGPDVLAALLKKLDINTRTLQRTFKKYVGVTPNQYRRICQFQLSFTQVRAKKFDTLTDVAYDNGFADQSHFIRSFREFVEITPKDYLKSGLKGKK